MAEGFDPFATKAGKVAVRARISAQILSVLRSHPEGISGLELVRSVTGRRATIYEVLKTMWEEGKVGAEPRMACGGGVTWLSK